MAGKWSAEETAKLKELLAKHSVEETRQLMGRSVYAIYSRMKKLKDSKDPVKYEDMNREDGEDIRRMYKRAENKVERLKILKDLYPSYTKETILAAALHNPFRERDKLYEQITKEQSKMKRVTRTFDEETKAAAVKAVLVDGERNTDVAERFGVSTGTLGGWLKKARDQQQEYMQYADKVEQEMSVAKDAEHNEKTIDWQQLKPRPEPVFKPVEESQKTEPAETVIEYVSEDTKPVIDETFIKAAAYDVIIVQMVMYPDSSTDTMMRFIQGVQALAQQLCCEVENELSMP